MKTEVLIRLNTYHADYINCGTIEGDVDIEHLKEFIKAGIEAYEDWKVNGDE